MSSNPPTAGTATGQAGSPTVSPTVMVETSDHVATITINRPDAMNGLDVATRELLRDVVQSVAVDTSVRAVVLTGSGRAFCAGQDLREHAAMLESGTSGELFTTVERHYNPLVHSLATMPKPVIAALNGVAAGAGASLAFACDMRIAAESAGINVAFAGVALSCDTGASWTLPKLVGHAKAIELLYDPRTLSAPEAHEHGLVTRVVPDEALADEAAKLAAKLAAGPTMALGSIRQALSFSAGHSLEESLSFEAGKMQLTGATRDHRHAVDSFLAKQKPEFEGR